LASLFLPKLGKPFPHSSADKMVGSSYMKQIAEANQRRLPECKSMTKLTAAMVKARKEHVRETRGWSCRRIDHYCSRTGGGDRAFL
jgi:hypothetical protein